MSTKPTFDPSKPFDVAKPKFDPTKPAEPVSPPESSTTPKSEADDFQRLLASQPKKELPKDWVGEDVVGKIAQETGQDPAYVRSAFRSFGKQTAGMDDTSELRRDVESTIGAIAKGSLSGIPQMIARMRESDPSKAAALEAVAKHVYDSETWGDIGQDVLMGLAPGSLIGKGVSAAAKALGLGARATTAAQIAAGAGEAAAGMAAASPGEEISGSAIGLAAGTALGSLPTMVKSAKRIASSADELNELKSIIRGDDQELTKLATDVIEAKGPEIEAVAKALDADEVRPLVGKMFGGPQASAEAWKEFAAKRDVPEFMDAIEDLAALSPQKGPKRNDLLRAVDDRIRLAADEETKAALRATKDEIRKEMPSNKGWKLRSLEDREKAARLEMRALGFEGDDWQLFEKYKILRGEAGRLLSHVDRLIPSLDLRKVKDRAKLGERADEAFRQGKLTGNFYRDMAMRDALVNQLESNVMARKIEANASDLQDPAGQWFKNLFYDLRFMGAEIDDRLGLDLGPTLDGIASAYNKQTILAENWGSKADSLLAARKASQLDPERITEVLTGISTDLSQEERSLARQYRKLFDSIRDEANSKYGMNIPRLENYAPMQLKRTKELAEILPEKAKESVAALEIKDPEQSIDSVRRILNAEDSPDALRQAARDLLDVRSIAERFVGFDIESIQDLNRVLAKFPELIQGKSKASFDASAAFARRGELPLWAREMNAERLLLGYIDSMAQAVTMNLPVQALKSRIDVLKAAGFEKAADYFNEYIGHLSGVRTGLRKVLESDSFGDGLASAIGIEGDVLRAAMHRAAQTVYAAHLGFNPRALIRNWTQPFFMTSTDVAGSGATHAYGQKLAMDGLKNAAKQLLRGRGTLMQKVGSELKARKLAPAEFTGEMRDALRSGLYDSLPEWAQKGEAVATNFERKAMYLYSHSDYVNRYVTMKMADRMGKDLVEGLSKVRAGQMPEGDALNAIRFIEGMEPGSRSRLRILLEQGAKSGNDVPLREVQDFLARYLINKTQLVYGTVGMNRFGRTMGPLFSMFTKWPAAISSEILFEWSRRNSPGRGEVNIMKKFITPALAVLVADRAFNEAGIDTEEPRAAQVFYKGGPFPQYAPAFSAFDLPKMTKPPALELPFALIEGAASLSKGEQDVNKAASIMKTALEKGVRTHVPVVSTTWNTLDRIYELGTNEKSPLTLKERK